MALSNRARAEQYFAVPAKTDSADPDLKESKKQARDQKASRLKALRLAKEESEADDVVEAVVAKPKPAEKKKAMPKAHRHA